MLIKLIIIVKNLIKTLLLINNCENSKLKIVYITLFKTSKLNHLIFLILHCRYNMCIIRDN